MITINWNIHIYICIEAVLIHIPVVMNLVGIQLWKFQDHMLEKHNGL